MFVNPQSDRAIYQPSGWTVTRTGSDTNDMTILKSTDLANNSFSSFTINDETSRGNQTYWTRLRWSSNTGLKLSQTKTLNPGSYTLTALVLNYNQNTSNNKAEIFAGSKSITASNSNTKNDGAGWKTLTVNFTIDEATETEIGFKLTHATETNGEQIVGVDNFVLMYTDFKAELRAVVAQAQAINARISTLSDDITTAQGVLNTANASKSTIEGAVTTLRSAIKTKLAAYTGLNAAGDDITSFIANNGFETSPIFDGTSLGSGSDPKSNATPTDGSTLLLNAKNVYQVGGWELLTTETSDFARTFTLPYDKTLYVWGNNAVAGQAVTSPTNGSSVTTSNDNLLFVEANWCENAELGVKQTLPLLAGSYRLTFDSYVTNAIGNAESRCGVSYGESTDYKWPSTLNTWTNNEVDFTLDAQTDVTISMGYKKIGNVGGGSSAHLYVDNVKLTYFDPLKLAEIQWQETWDALDALDETALPNAAEDAITAALAETKPTTVEGYNTAKAALQAFIDSYDDIKAAYDKALALIDFATNEKTNSTGTKTTIEAAISTATTDIETRTTADDLTSDYNTLETARQTYVTSGAQPTSGHTFDWTFKMTNPDFEDGTTGWTNERNTTGQYNYGTTTSAMQHGTKGLDVWAQQINYINVYQSQSLPAGVYELSAYVYSSNPYQQHVYAHNGKDNPSANLTSNSEWQKLTASFTNFSEVSTKLGLYSLGKNQNGNSDGWFRLDNFQLLYKGVTLDDATADALLATVPKGTMQATVESDLSSAKTAFESAKTIENYNALKAAIDAANASIAAYTKLKGELDKMDALFGSLETNVYSATAYATNYIDVKNSYDGRSISTDAANAYEYGERVTGAMPAIMLSSWKVGETAALTDASLYMNAWSTEGNSDGSEMTTPFYEYYVANGNALAEKTFTATVEGLTAGTNYLVSAIVRVRQQDNQTKADDDVTFQVNDGDVVNAADGTQSAVRSEMYYKTVRAFGEADGDGKLAIKVVVKDGNHISWLAFKDVHYSEVTAPTDAHKTALASAISTAESKTIGFAEGEYAPYTNIEARKALAAAKAIDVDVNTDYEVVAATTALTSATWDENEEEMNAVSDELFNGTEYGVAGWTRSVSWNNVGGDKSYSIPAGTMTYGDMAYHEMPLEGNTVYKLTFGHRKWDSGNADNGGQVSVLNGSGEGLALTSYTGTSEQSLQNETYFFRTGAEGNYTFTVTAASGRLTFGNVVIKKAVAENLTIAEDAAAAPTYNYANVTLARSFNEGWNALCLPFDAAAFDGAEIAELESETAEGENVTLNFKKVDAFKANTPCLVYFPSAVAANKSFDGVIVNPASVIKSTESFDFKGVYTVTNIEAGNWVVSGGELKKASAAINLKPTRTYFAPNTKQARIVKFLVDGEETSGLKELFANQGVAVDGIYNLKGQKVVRAQQKGIYVVNGKKIVK